MLGCYLSGMAAWIECGYKEAAAVKTALINRYAADACSKCEHWISYMENEKPAE